MALDLNALRNTIIENQRHGNINPQDSARQVHVDSRGDILSGSDVSGRQQEPITKVPQSTFAKFHIKE